MPGLYSLPYRVLKQTAMVLEAPSKELIHFARLLALAVRLCFTQVSILLGKGLRRSAETILPIASVKHNRASHHVDP
jgi:hypothetical protein